MVSVPFDCCSGPRPDSTMLDSAAAMRRTAWSCCSVETPVSRSTWAGSPASTERRTSSKPSVLFAM